METSLFVAVVLVVAGVLALEVGLSSAITEVLAGVVLGLLVETGDVGWLVFLAHFGLLGLMFIAGFEVDPAMLRKTWRASLAIGCASFLAPFLGVFGLGRLAFGLEARAAGLVATGLSTTSLALVYHFLRERKLLAGETGQMVFGAAMVVDVLSMVGLALLLGHLGWATAVFVLAAAPAFVGLPRAGQWLFARYRGSLVEFELRFLLLLLVGMGFLAERAGIHAAIVAFLVGLLMSEVIQDHAALEEKLKGVIFSFFAPAFFLQAGTRLDLRGLDLPTLGLTAVLFVVAAGLKYAGTALVAGRLAAGLGHFAGVLFNYRLTFGIITATVGREEGLLDRRLFATVLLIVLVSAALPMVLLRDRPTELD